MVKEFMNNNIKLLKEKKLQEILKEQEGNIKDISDLTAGDEPSLLFYLLADKLGYLLSNDPDEAVSKRGVEIRHKLNVLIKKLGSSFLTNPQVIEKRSELMNDKSIDDEIKLPDEPVIWTANHAFKDDTLASILAVQRHAYILFGSLPQFYNTIDGVTAWLNGVCMANRKVSSSKRASIKKGLKVMSYGADLMMFPEGVWNKTPEKLLINLWPGVYRISKETGAKVVPMVHYIKDCASDEKDNIIHTVVDNPIRIDDLSEKAALEYLRDVSATWFYLMMEKYGKSTRAEEIANYNSSMEAWEHKLLERLGTVSRYDLEIETTADYRPKDEIEQSQVWQAIANINNINSNNIDLVVDAKQKIKTIKENDFQRRF